MDGLRQKRQINATLLGKTVDRGTHTEFNPVNQITIPTNVCCSLGGKNVPETFVFVLRTAKRTMKWRTS